MSKKTLNYILIIIAIILLAGLLFYFVSISETGSEILWGRIGVSTITSPDNEKTITIYFPDKNRFNLGTDPYEVAVKRKISSSLDSKKAVLDALYAGPTENEKERGLFMIYSRTSGAIMQFDGTSGVVKIFLSGKCNGNGASYSLEAILFKNFRQFRDVKYIRIYDEKGETLSAKENTDSGPACLEP